MAESNRDRAARGGWITSVTAEQVFAIDMGTNETVVIAADGTRHRVSVPSQAGLDASTKRRTMSGDGTLRVYADDGVTVLREDPVDMGGPTLTPVGEMVLPFARETAARASTPANLQPAASQIWIQVPQILTRALLDADSTVTVRRVVDGWAEVGPLTSVSAADMRDPASGWRCIGVATEHGRVMVGDGFQTGAGYPVTISAVSPNAGSVIVRWADDGEVCNRAEMIAAWTRTRYAPARVGERYRWRASGRVARVDRFKHGVPRWNWDSEMGDGRVCFMDPGGCFPVDAWERLDPSTASHAVAPVPQVATGSRADLQRLLAERLSVHAEDVEVRTRGPGDVEVAVRWFSASAVQAGLDELRAEGRLPLGAYTVARADGAPVPQVAESDADLRARIGVAHRAGCGTWSGVALAKVASEIARTLPASIDGVTSALRTIMAGTITDMERAATEWSPAFRDCNPLTATGADLDRLAPLWGVERRMDATARETDDGRVAVSGRAGATVVSVEGFGAAARAFTRIHDAIPKPTLAEAVRARNHEVRRAIDSAIAADHGPFAHARAAALHAWAETLYSGDTVADVAAVHAGLLRYEACRGSRREPSLAAMDVGVPETARAMYERERAAVRIEAVTPPEEQARPTGGASLNGWQTAAHFWERWSR